MSGLISRIFQVIRRRIGFHTTNVLLFSVKIFIGIIGIGIPLYTSVSSLIFFNFIPNDFVVRNLGITILLGFISFFIMYSFEGFGRENDRSYLYGLKHGTNDLFKVACVIGSIDFLFYIGYTLFQGPVIEIPLIVGMVTRPTSIFYLLLALGAYVVSDAIQIMYTETHNFLEYTTTIDSSSLFNEKHYRVIYMDLDPDSNPQIYEAIMSLNQCISCTDELTPDWEVFNDHLNRVNGLLIPVEDINEEPEYLEFREIYSEIQTDMGHINEPSELNLDKWNRMKTAFRDFLVRVY